MMVRKGLLIAEQAVVVRFQNVDDEFTGTITFFVQKLGKTCNILDRGNSAHFWKSYLAEDLLFLLNR